MAFMDDLKTDQRTQILVAGMIFFAIAFPVYFGYAASDVEELNLSGPVGNYSVEGTYSYHMLGSGEEDINDGETADLSVNSDSIASEIDGKNIVGVRATMTFTDDETGGATCGPGQSVDDDVSGHLMHSDLHNTQQVTSGDTVSILWHNSSIIGTTVSNMSESDIMMMLDGMGMGFGEHSLDISVIVNTGGGAGCPSSDDGEEVAYTIELISLEYDIEMVEVEPEE